MITINEDIYKIEKIHKNDIYTHIGCNIDFNEAKNILDSNGIKYEIADEKEKRFYLKLENDIKYQVLTDNDWQRYIQIITYIEKNHNPRLYKKLIREFDLETLKRKKIDMKYHPEHKIYYINNGNHRTSLWFHNFQTEYLTLPYFKMNK